MKSNKQFYNSLCGFYDEMIDFNKAVKNRVKQLEKIILPGMKTAADIGCGTGIDSIALSQLGLNVTSFDPSPGMLEMAINNSKKFNSKITFLNYSADKIPSKFNDNFDIVVSLGNTFANIPLNKIVHSTKRCRQILKKEGELIVQILNYQKILKEKVRIVKINSNEKKYFIRFYDFLPDKTKFNVLSFEKNNLSKPELVSTQIHPYTSRDLKSILLKTGFRELKFYGNFDGNKFQISASNDLIIECKA